MHDKLKFSWGHIIAFIALIVASYISFVGYTYLTDGNFTTALIAMAITDLVFIIFFVGAQQMKASGEHIQRKIFWERVLFFGAPAVFIAAMIGMSHFWTVHSQEEEVVKNFTSSINNSKQLFADYEDYAHNRIAVYGESLDHIIANRESDPKTYTQAGFTRDMEKVQRDNMVEVLTWQLFSPNFDKLMEEATQWIDDANQGASTWNVFLIGNTREIKESLAQWEAQLKEFAAPRMSNEEVLGPVDDFNSEGARKAIAGIESMSTTFTTQHFPTWQAFIFAIFLYLMLIFPYLIQERHPKSWYRLIGNEHSRRNKKQTEYSSVDTSGGKKNNADSDQTQSGDRVYSRDDLKSF